jgi:predicted lipoprotein
VGGLRGRGLNRQADALVRAVRLASTRLQGLAPAARPQVLAAARELAQLKRLVEAELAGALEVSLGFSDADGD